VVRCAVGILALVVGGCASPVVSRPDGPDAETYGARDGYPVAVINRPKFFVGAFTHYDQLIEARLIRRAEPVAVPAGVCRACRPLRVRGDNADHRRLPGAQPCHGAADRAGRHDPRGERYQYGRTERQRFTSFSMAKTIVAMLVGIAMAEGRIRSLDEPAAAYVPVLAETEYGGTALRHLLEMSSGVRFVEDYSGRDDAIRLMFDTVGQFGPGGADAVKRYNERLRPSGSRFAYSSAETQVLGLVLRAAVDRTVADYFREKIWEPIGAEADATWIVDRAGQEAAFCCLNAVLRDYARLGRLLAHDGRVGDRQIIPAAWLQAATTAPAEKGHLKPYEATSFYGYGYQTWVFPGPRRMFALLGAHGQAIFVDPASRLVLVHTAVRLDPNDKNLETRALWQALVHQLGR
jgi:CubicO group peptidase (beta-lactamase class C family)